MNDIPLNVPSISTTMPNLARFPSNDDKTLFGERRKSKLTWRWLGSKIASHPWREEKALHILSIDEGRTEDNNDDLSGEHWEGQGASPSLLLAEEGPPPRRSAELSRVERDPNPSGAEGKRAVDGGNAASGDASAKPALARATATQESTPTKKQTVARTSAVSTPERTKEARSSRVVNEV